MKLLKWGAILVVISMLAACASVQVSQDYQPSTDFTRLKSYGWKAGAAPVSADVRVTNPLLQQRFHDAIDRVLIGRGYQQAAQPDMLVSYSYSIVSRIESDDFDADFGFGFGRRHSFGGLAFGTGGTVRQYDVGVLAIDIHDAAGNNLLWRGTGSEIVTTHRTPEAVTASVQRMVGEILGQFPPRTVPAAR